MSTRQPSPRARRVWRRLMDFYGSRVTEQFGELPPQDWCDVIDKVDDDRLNYTMIAIRSLYLQFPPTLPQFEAAIQARRVLDGPSIVDQLEDYTHRLSLCAHQRMSPRNWFGRQSRDSKGHLQGEIRGIVIDECKLCSKHAHRVTTTDIVPSRFHD